MKIKKVTLILGLILCLVSCMDDPNSYKTITILELKNDECKVYLKHIEWGLTGDNSRTYISLNKNLKDTVKEPYFRAISFFYKLENPCVLNVYDSDSLHRSNFSKVKVVLKDDGAIDYPNFEKEGYKNILYN